jgi:hypothetical protein
MTSFYDGFFSSSSRLICSIGTFSSSLSLSSSTSTSSFGSTFTSLGWLYSDSALDLLLDLLLDWLLALELLFISDASYLI